MHSLFRIIKTLTTFLCLVVIILFPLEYANHETRAATKDEILDAHVRIDVEWNNYNPGNSNISQTGSFFVEVKGTIIRMPDIDPFFYAPKNLVANYNYSERSVYVRPSGRCPELYSEQKGSGTVRILDTDEVEDPTKDGVLTITAGSGWEQSLSLLKELKGKERTPARQKPIDKELKTDIYTFVLTVPMATTLTEQSSPCSRYKTSPWSTGVALAPYLNLTKRGMAGSYSWTSNKLDTGLQIRDYPNQTQFEPQKGEGNVKYRVSWNFGKPKPMVEIRWEEKDVTDKQQNVVVGERIKLKAVVYPEDKDPKKGQWTIQGKFIEDFVVRGQEGKIDKLEGDELKKPEIKFHWWDKGESLTVNYTTVADGEDLKAKTTFLVKKPMITLIAETPRGTPGCWEVKDKDVYSHNELVYYVPNSHTMIFRHSVIPPEFSGETQYVQLVLVKGRWIKKEDALYPHCLDANKKGLDGQYPYSSNPEAYDTPGVPVSFLYDKDLNINFSFNMYLMFKPSKQGAIFVPLRVIDWVWTGTYKWNEKTKKSICEVTRTEAPKDKAAEKYLEWTQILKRGKEEFKECK